VGWRIEGTQASFLGTIAKFSGTVKDPNTGDFVFQGDTPAPGAQTYTNFLPSVQVQYNINGSTNIRAAYGRGLRVLTSPICRLSSRGAGAQQGDNRQSQPLDPRMPMTMICCSSTI